MAKHVHVCIPEVCVNETDCEVLRMIAGYAEQVSGYRCAPVAISRKQFCSSLDKTERTIIRSCNKLCEEGLLITRGHTLDNGARLANTYEVTALGLEVVRLTDDRKVRMGG